MREVRFWEEKAVGPPEAEEEEPMAPVRGAREDCRGSSKVLRSAAYWGEDEGVSF
jgi:hypothetical protein